MRTIAEPTDANFVKLSVEVDEDEIRDLLDNEVQKLIREVRVPGFRPGKVPRKVLEARLGLKAIRQRAIQEALPDLYARAVVESNIDPIDTPQIDIISGEEEGALTFDAKVQVRPNVSIAGYQGLKVTVPSPTVSVDEVDEQINRLRRQFGELVDVARPARDGDYVTIDLKAYRHSEVLDDLSMVDSSYEVGSGTIVAELDEQLKGAKVGDIFKFNGIVNGEEIAFQVLVKEVKEVSLPDPDDSFAEEASEFSTIEELREDIRSRLERGKTAAVSRAVREEVINALTELVAEEIPEVLVEAEMNSRLRELSNGLQMQKMTVQEYLSLVGATEDQLVADLREGAIKSVKADLALRSLAQVENIEVSDEELSAELATLAAKLGIELEQLRQRLEHDNSLSTVRSDLRRTKALEWLLEHVEVVDESGNQVQKELYLNPQGSSTVVTPASSGDLSEHSAEPEGAVAGEDFEVSHDADADDSRGEVEE
jgi:trigger factor